MSVTSNSVRRATLFASAAVCAFAATGANAQSGPLSINNVRDSATSTSTLSIGDVNDSAQAGAALSMVDARDVPFAPPISIANVTETPSITINNNFTPTAVRDPVNVTGIGQIVTDAGGGSVGLCTGSLINPRTVIFAAHCVNSRAATDYGANSGGRGIAVAFETNTRANAPGQSDELVNWLTGGSTGPGRFQTNRAQSLYNILQVVYNPLSQAPASCTSATSCFLEADIAMAALDAPTTNVPQWILLFSPLTSPAAINPATGTGYHVTIAGYGQNGNGTTGATGTDFRRRVAENMLGALTSINARNLFLFGTTGTPSRPQLLYWTDFDDPARGTAAANPRDFNGFRDNALTREGLTGPGDSGGPLIIDQAFARPVVIGVLSGGSTFFAGQPQSSYGAQSFYQPLFLYWDWIVANNPYRYVTAAAGNRNWEDATTWVTTLDPAYQVLTGGQLVNGLPTELGGALVAQTPQFGEVCFQAPLNTPAPPATNECENRATGAARNNVPNTPTGTGDSSAPLTVNLAEGGGEAAVVQAGGGTSATTLASGGRLSLGSASDVAISGAASGMIDGAVESPQAAPGFRDGPLPAPSLANGLPGATNFVANNSDGVRTTGVAARYYDVTLRNAGTVTLSSAVTIDRFAIAGASSVLTVNTTGSLTSLIDITQTNGVMNVNGALRSSGDYALIGGILLGNGTVTTPFLTSVLGSIAPGTIGGIGTLTIAGNVVLSSGTQTSIDLGANGVSDLLRVIPNGTSTGTINLGGVLGLNPIVRPIFGNTYTVVQADGGRTGTFNAVSAVSAGVLFPVVTYTANAVNVRIDARPYATFVNAASPVQVAYATLLDGNRARGNYALLADLYGELDVLSAANVQAVLETAAPRTEATTRSLGRMSTDALGRFYRERQAFIASGDAGGTLTMIGRPVQMASTAINGTTSDMRTMSDMGSSSNLVQSTNGLPDHVSAYLAAGYLDGRADALPSLFGGRDNLEGWYVAGGIEIEALEGMQVGIGVHYAATDGQYDLGRQTTDGSLAQGSLYSVSDLGNGLVLNAQLNVGEFSAETRRIVTVGTTVFTLDGRNDAFAASGELGLGKTFDLGGLTLTPHGAGRYTLLDFGQSRETGGGLALVTDGGDYESFQGRVGADLGGSINGWVRPRLTATYVHEFMDQDTSILAGFAATGFTNGAVNFLLPNADRNWAEIGAGVRFDTPRVSFDFSADTTVGRGDLSYRTYRVGATIRF